MKHVSSCQLSGWNNASESSLFMQKLPECDVQNLFYIELTVCIHWIQLFTEWRISVKTFYRNMDGLQQYCVEIFQNYLNICFI